MPVPAVYEWEGSFDSTRPRCAGLVPLRMTTSLWIMEIGFTMLAESQSNLREDLYGQTFFWSGNVWSTELDRLGVSVDGILVGSRARAVFVPRRFRESRRRWNGVARRVRGLRCGEAYLHHLGQ